MVGKATAPQLFRIASYLFIRRCTAGTLKLLVLFEKAKMGKDEVLLNSYSFFRSKNLFCKELSVSICKTFSTILFSCCLALLWTSSLQARPRTSVKTIQTRAENPKGSKSKLIMPYAFPSESMGFIVGVGGGMKGYGQDQMLVGGTAFGSFDSAVALFLGVWDYRPSFAKRFFFGAQGMVGHYPRQKAYAAPAYRAGETRPGSNDSNQNDFIEESGYDNWTDFKLEFVLPLGSARHDALQDVKLKGGLLESAPIGGDVWNPMTSGVTSIMLRQFNRYRSFEADQGDLDATTHPFELAIGYNNTDFPINPSYGSSQFLSVTHDFGWLESPHDWTFVEFEASKYFSFGDSDWAKQRILALNFWTGDTPTWEEHTNADGVVTLDHQPPFYEGANLGGFYRMRAYPADRFRDKSVIYTTAEYRYTLDWNPIAEVSWLRFLQSDWLQLVGFIEGGQVAEDYTFSDLFDEWKFDAGVGVRSMFAGGVVRFDVAVGDEDGAAWVMFGHPF